VLLCRCTAAAAVPLCCCCCCAAALLTELRGVQSALPRSPYGLHRRQRPGAHKITQRIARI
jgi:hypothetical protein